MKGIIIEGPDGAGKSTLVKEILREFPEIELVERPASSVAGPKPNRDNWVEWHLDYVMHQGHPVLTDRHPMISEYIYGPITRQAIEGRFLSPQWTHDQLERMYRRCVVVWCIPPLDTVIENVNSTPQMHGVQQHIRRIWYEYRYVQQLWSGLKFSYDYTRPHDWPALMRYLSIHTRPEA